MEHASLKSAAPKIISIADQSAPPLAPELVRQELQKVLTSAQFTNSKRLRAFLSYIVEQALAGKSADLKEYVLGVEVFERRAGFDPRIDPIVRVEAGRLRARIREYYKGEGKFDDIRIDCAKRGYQPVFAKARFLQPRTRPSPLKRIRTVAFVVLPFDDLSPARDQEYFCEGLAEEIISELSKVEGIRVVSRSSARALKGQSLDVREIGKMLNVSLALEGSVRKDSQRLRITAQVTNAADRFELWSETHERTTSDPFLVQDEVARSVVNNIQTKILGR